MANPEHEAILRQGVKTWNQWRKAHRQTRPNLSNVKLTFADLSNINLKDADLSTTNLQSANLRSANLSNANLYGANLVNAYLSNVNLYKADLSGANLCNATLIHADLSSVNLYRADLSGANLYNSTLIDADLNEANLSKTILDSADLSGANLTKANLSKANLTGADISQTILIGANFEQADISGCRIYGIAAWNLKVENSTQSNLIITQEDEPEITVDNLEIAQFVYLLLNNAKLRSVIDTLTTKSVLILGRFTPERKAILDGIREVLRQHGYVPMLFDFEKPANRDLTETVMTLASLARFVIADLSDPNSIPHELMSFADKLFSVPVQGIFCPTEAHPQPYSMYEHLRRLPHVLPIFRYETADELMAALEESVIKPAEEKVKAVRPTSGLL